MHPACSQLATVTMRATRTRGSKHAVMEINVVKLPKGAILELELSIDKNPTNMRTKVLIEVELVKQIDYIAATNKVTLMV